MTIILWHQKVCGIYYRDKINGVDEDTSEGKSIKKKTKIIEKTELKIPWPPVCTEGGDRLPWPTVPFLNTKVTIPLKYLSKFRKIS